MILKVFLVISLSTLGLLGSPSYFSNADKNITRLDKLGYYIYTHSKNSWEESHHIASAILHTNRPRDVATLGHIESNYNMNAIGDKGHSFGGYQIQPKHWYVPNWDVYGQAEAACSILTTVGRFSKYNGSGHKARLYEARAKSIRMEIKI